MSMQKPAILNNENKRVHDEGEDGETKSFDGSDFSEPRMNSSSNRTINGVSSDESINNIQFLLKGLNTRQLPTWDHNRKKRESIKEHLQMAKQLGNRLGWSDKELAHEVMLSLRGESGTVAGQFSQIIQDSFMLLEKELIKFFWVPKPKSQMMKEFNTLAWKIGRAHV